VTWPSLRVIGDHQDHTWSQERFPTISGVEIVGEHPEAVGIELRKTLKSVISQVLVRRCKIGVHLVERSLTLQGRCTRSIFAPRAIRASPMVWLQGSRGIEYAPEPSFSRVHNRIGIPGNLSRRSKPWLCCLAQHGMR
jgi:hypothetical protein